MLNILFHGASVTKQGGVDSYFYQLQALFDSNEYSLSKVGYGGCYFDDACFLTIEKDTAGKDFNVVFLEWCTPGTNSFNLAKIKHVICSLLDKKILPIFLILARTDNLIDRTSESQIKLFCFEHSILALDLRVYIDPKNHLRDDVHTNQSGAKVYADLLFKHILMIEKDLLFHFKKININNSISYKINHYKFDRSICEGNSINIILDSIEKGSEIIFSLLIGPDSPWILVNKKTEILIWDKWCHFERQNFKRIWDYNDSINAEQFNLTIDVLDKNVDYTSCQRELNYCALKKLNITDIYSVNCAINDIKEFKSI